LRGAADIKEENKMLAIDCPCGHRLEAPERDALFTAAR
jgi:hypothetical protein